MQVALELRDEVTRIRETNHKCDISNCDLVIEKESFSFSDAHRVQIFRESLSSMKFEETREVAVAHVRVLGHLRGG